MCGRVDVVSVIAVILLSLAPASRDMSIPFTRRRSHSLSSSSPSPSASPLASPLSTSRPPHRLSVKRLHSSHRSSSSSPHLLDSAYAYTNDGWNDATKRLRRDPSPYHTSCSLADPFSSSGESRSTSSSSPRTPFFASSPADFFLASHPAPFIASPSHRIHEDPTELQGISSAELAEVAQLRASAFGELRKSIEENGEDLVRRMRDLEHSRSRDQSIRARSASHPKGVYKRRLRRKRLSPTANRVPTRSEDEEDPADDVDDIQIFSALPSPGGFPFRASRNRSHATQEADIEFDMDVDGDCILSTSSPSTHPASLSTTPLSMSASSSPRLSPCAPSQPFLFRAEHRLPALGSLELDMPLRFDPCEACSFPHSPLPLPTTASRSEKAIAALSLALASGAGGLNDYSRVRAFDASGVEDNSLANQAGELWH